MQYAIEFDLSEDYCGPLEYYFFGDDDMWVFLTDQTTGKSQLVCDIGGVHSSVGEYVNLWDYIEKGSAGGYTLTFFYTERGCPAPPAGCSSPCPPCPPPFPARSPNR